MKGDLTLGGKAVTETTTVGNVTFVVDFTVSFTDVFKNNWFYNDVAYVAQHKLIR